MANFLPFRNYCGYLTSKSRCTLFDEIVDQLRSRVRHFDAKSCDLVSEIVEQPHRRDGQGDTERGRDEGFGDSGTDGADTGVLSLCQRDEGTDDADDRTEQSDERSGRADGSKAGEAAFQLGRLNG